jgi:hypothetical protein
MIAAYWILTVLVCTSVGCSDDDEAPTAPTKIGPPPRVDRPPITVDELKAAPSTLTFGDKELNFYGVTVWRDEWPAMNDRGVMVTAQVSEKNRKKLTEARLDFLWVVHELGVWEPDIPDDHKWNVWFFEAWAVDGPKWPIDSQAEVVVGFVTQKGEVKLMRASTTIFDPF